MKKFFKFLGIAILLLIVFVGVSTYPKLDIVSGFSAKSVASGHFIDGDRWKLLKPAIMTLKPFASLKMKLMSKENLSFLPLLD